MHRGYIKIWRKIDEWDWYKCSDTVHLFLHLLLKANHKTYSFMGIQIERGQVVCGRKRLSDDIGQSEQKIRANLYKLKSTNDITIKSTSNFSVISIVNYEIYQEESTTKITSKSTNDQPAINQQSTTIKECKNVITKYICASFDAFWNAYPRRKSKKIALKAWLKINPDGPLLGKMLDAIDRAKNTDQWRKDGGQYIPYPATWLNSGAWEDELDSKNESNEVEEGLKRAREYSRSTVV